MKGEELTFNSSYSFVVQLHSLFVHATLKLFDFILFVLGPEEQFEEENDLDRDANEISLE